jgi:hypothetical protein
MLMPLATAVGLVIWIVLWSLGAKAIDSFLITATIVLVAGAVKIALPFLPGTRAR